MNCLVVGASAGFGRSLAEALAESGHSLFLVASDERDLKALASHLALKNGVKVGFAACHIAANESWVERLASQIGPPQWYDAIFFPIGASSPEDTGALSEAATRSLVEINFLSVVLLVSHFLPAFTARGSGQIVAFGSVASVRGRSANIVYSAAKRALLGYFESLRHLTSRTRIRVHFYQLGYLNTQQAFGKRLLFPKLDSTKAARTVLNQLDRRSAIRYLPQFWRPIAWVVRTLPWLLFKRLSF